jgi:hypothetical protein
MTRFDDLSEGERWRALVQLLRSLLGERPALELALLDPGGEVYCYLVPPQQRVLLNLTPDLKVVLRERCVGSDRQTVPIGDLLAALDSRDGTSVSDLIW